MDMEESLFSAWSSLAHLMIVRIWSQKMNTIGSRYCHSPAACLDRFLTLLILISSPERALFGGINETMNKSWANTLGPVWIQQTAAAVSGCTWVSRSHHLVFPKCQRDNCLKWKESAVFLLRGLSLGMQAAIANIKDFYKIPHADSPQTHFRYLIKLWVIKYL